MLKIKSKAGITGFSLHHFGGTLRDRYASTQNFKEDVIENAHATRWPGFKSELNGSHIGYTFIIWPDGSYTQYRLIGESTAAVKGFNDELISGCLAGNFNKDTYGKPVDRPTQAARETLQKIVEWIFEEFKMPVSRFLPHRYWSPTQCYGNSLDSKFAMRLLIPILKERLKLLKFLVSLYVQFISLKAKFGTTKLGAFGDDRGCPGYLE